MASAELQLSGFGTLGGAISDQDFTYQRSINEDGTLNRDSVIGFQLDGQFTPSLGATIQAKAFPSDHRENGWDPKLTWAFVSWRPTNGLLFRGGSLRIPLMLLSANSDVGVTYPFARLPTEVYSVAPVNDVTGLAFTWNWFRGETEWTLDGYGGQNHSDWRFYLRDGLPPYVESGARYEGSDFQAAGLVLTLRQNDSTWRVGYHRVQIELDAGASPETYPYVSIAPGMGYYQVLSTIPGPGIPMVKSLISNTFTLSADIALPNDFRLMGEYARRTIVNATLGADTHSAYLALLKPFRKWTPYVYIAGIRSDGDVLDLYESMNDNRVPDFIPNASLINASQRFGADWTIAYDQYTLAIGTSYNLTRTSKVKAEFAHARSGIASGFIDAPTGEDSGDREVNVLSLSYSFTF